MTDKEPTLTSSAEETMEKVKKYHEFAIKHVKHLDMWDCPETPSHHEYLEIAKELERLHRKVERMENVLTNASYSMMVIANIFQDPKSQEYATAYKIADDFLRYKDHCLSQMNDE